MRILLVEDDEPIAQALVATLREQNYVVDIATDGQEGLELVEAFGYDLILLDVMLPKLDGISLCGKLRNSGYQMPILLLTAKDTTEDKVKGLDAGADDYLVKPFDIPELTARIRALLRRGNAPLSAILERGQLQLNPNTCDVTYASKPVTLTPTEYRLLELFLRNSNRVYSRSAILDHLWSFDEPPAEDTIRAHIKGLRQKLKAAGAPADLIETVYGIGYRLKPLSSEDKYREPPKILMAGLPEELGFWLQQRLGKVSVRVTHTGEETLQEISAAPQSWSLLIVDVQLKEPAGVEVLRQVASMRKGKHELPTIWCVEKGEQTGNGERFNGKGKGKTAGNGASDRVTHATCVLVHPIDRVELARQVAKILELPLSTREDGSSEEATLAAVGKVWERFKDRIGDRVTTLEQASNALKSGELNSDLHAKAQREAHKLAGSLGTFGFSKGSEIAKEVEQLLRDRPLECEDGLHLSKLVVELRSQLERSPSPKQTASVGVAEDKPMLLLVDGDPEQGSRLTAETQQWGMHGIVANTIARARAAIGDRRPEVVILDLDVPAPETDGKRPHQEALDFLAELANRFPPIPVVVLTDRSSVEERLEVARLGGRAFLQKPLRPERIMEVVTQVLQRAHNTEAKIMVVDDDLQVLSLVRTFLEPWGLKSLPLSDPHRFWETLEHTMPDLLVLDVEMPHISGIELCQVVRNDPRWSGLPVLFLTGHRDPNTVHRVFAAGADDYVSKPIVGPELVNRILNRLERVQLLRNMAETDALTGVANRRKSTQELEKFLKQAATHDQPMCLAILDLDRFKWVNDRYGHATGDTMLRHFGKLLLRTFRSEDVVARWGGDEFVVGMYGMTKINGMKRLSELLDIMHQESAIPVPEGNWQVTFSAGVAEYPEDGIKLEALYRCADDALYRAKEEGRDRIVAR
ncbi:response regulator [Phormidium sp. CCY1219]|uniref:response regulator n=1 Tax=Phormidium sp. CCY1219 TaxID=2886104 RepID=UPI002D1EA8CD|nr:response regulator [Phormidium sp. CCY1219]MEB3830651.1 response regulator [Phormidium sp. CCY1219]